jgi:hypothetical protein
MSARDADGPVTGRCAAEGIRRASVCRMIGGSHINSPELFVVSEPWVLVAPLARAFTAWCDGCLRGAWSDCADNGNDRSKSTQGCL